MSNTWQLIEPYRGAHIRVKFHDFYHHGIYVSDECVIQFGLPSDVFSPSEDVKVISSSIAQFCGKEMFFEVRVYKKDEKKRKRKDEEIVAFALSKIGMGGYNILKNNCEHFANLCVFGESSSKQVEAVYSDVNAILDKINK